ncbi:R3H domain-containing nucleic acid-binding protein [Lyngbya aestuarii]|uniref:R3H domain-containing nucleic acid-binding protein n=1 Tax=Lyngbya aestuarii TaxID=118322 RepID=UPI00403E1B94
MNDQPRQRGQQWLAEIMRLAGLPADVEATDVKELQEDRTSYWLTIDQTPLTVEQIQTLIGPKGSVIDALQYLANSILNLSQDQEQQAAYTIELDGYRTRRQAELQALAAQAAQEVRETGQEMELKSLSSAERRQVHTFFKEWEDLETYSQGQEPDRRLIVRRR